MKAVLLAALTLMLVACDSKDETGNGPGGAGGNSSEESSGSGSGNGEGSGNGSGSGSGSGNQTPEETCTTSIVATIRDFQSTHPDFESFNGTQATTGLVNADLGTDGKPVHAAMGPTSQTTGPENFNQWYRDVDGVNETFEVELPLTASTTAGFYTYDSSAFFPVDGRGFGNESWAHNFHFTTEVHATFKYEGGEVFQFRGDDDIWVFVNGKLVIDLGGLHPALEASVDFDARAAELGLVVGETYPLDIFHAERHTDQSNFRIDTSIRCFTPVIL